MNTKRFILASASPRRKELLLDMHIPFDVLPSSNEEHFDSTLPVEQAIEKIAYNKAKSVYELHPGAIVLGCDTMVALHDKVLGKPKDKEEARAMLQMLSGKTHQVISGVAILQEGREDIFHQVSNVTFYELDEELIERYINSDEPYDKAGGYGIQGTGKLLVSEIQGDYFNIVGLPIAKVYRILKKYL